MADQGGLIEALRDVANEVDRLAAECLTSKDGFMAKADRIRELAPVVSVLAQIPKRPGWAEPLTPGERDALRWLSEAVR